MNLVTPLNRVLGLGSAKGGFGDWWAQRVAGVALIVLGLWFALALIRLEDLSYAAVVSWIQQPMTSILLILTLLTAMYHSHLGIRVVIEDYVHDNGAKVAAIIVSTFVHAALAIGTVFAVLRISFGAAS